METYQKERIKHIIKQREVAHKFYLDRSDVYRSFSELEQKTYTEGALTRKQKELIAVGISVVLNCESCMEWHINQAIKTGATQEEILEAIEVGIEMSGGPGTVAARFAMDVLEYYRK
jgi:AhpD family alkylhydroperoxidase